ncbi:MAG: ATP-binding protein [Owenweeksia sp.]|nr:ATP-binding protein [Owenweeksia sp.]
MGWLEYLRNREVGEDTVAEMEKDINRLNTITDRFSKIGSRPALTPSPVAHVTRDAVGYLQARSPGKIKISFTAEPATESLSVRLNRPLYEWVIENLVRNAIDAIEGTGSIQVRVQDTTRRVVVEVEDSGKGISANKQKTIFRPGYTTKNRGWGLGLSLARRIIEDYHGGRIFVAHSELGKGSIFRILLNK